MNTILCFLLLQAALPKPEEIVIACGEIERPLVVEALSLSDKAQFLNKCNELALTVRQGEGYLEVFDEKLFGIAQLRSSIALLRKCKDLDGSDLESVKLSDVWLSIEEDHENLASRYGVKSSDKLFSEFKVGLRNQRRVEITHSDGTSLWINLPDQQPLSEPSTTLFPQVASRSRGALPISEPIRKKDKVLCLLTPGLEVGSDEAIQMELRLLTWIRNERRKLEMVVQSELREIALQGASEMKDTQLIGLAVADLNDVEKGYISNFLQGIRPVVDSDLGNWKISQGKREPHIEFKFQVGDQSNGPSYRLHRIPLVRSSPQTSEEPIRPTAKTRFKAMR